MVHTVADLTPRRPFAPSPCHAVKSWHPREACTAALRLLFASSHTCRHRHSQFRRTTANVSLIHCDTVAPTSNLSARSRPPSVVRRPLSVGQGADPTTPPSRTERNLALTARPGRSSICFKYQPRFASMAALTVRVPLSPDSGLALVRSLQTL